jgi:hypothetical protein
MSKTVETVPFRPVTPAGWRDFLARVNAAPDDEAAMAIVNGWLVNRDLCWLLDSLPDTLDAAAQGWIAGEAVAEYLTVADGRRHRPRLRVIRSDPRYRDALAGPLICGRAPADAPA